MDFRYNYTDEQESFRAEVREYLAANIPEDMRSPVDARLSLTQEQYDFWHGGMHQQLAAKGWMYPTYPTEYGGGGLSGDHETIIMEEFELAGVVRDFTNALCLPTLMVWATEEQKKQFLTPLLKCEKVAFQNFSEPEAGSDLAAIQSRAERDGDDWIITGIKTWISGHGEPDWLFGPIVTDQDSPRHRNLGYFMIPAPSEGLTIQKLDLLTGHDQQSIFMDHVRVAGDHLIGGDHQGWQVAQSTLEIEHGGRGVAFPKDEPLENLLDYVKTVSTGDGALADDPVLQQLAMQAAIDSQINALFQRRNFHLYQAREEMTYQGSQSSLWRKSFNITNAARAREIMGMHAMTGVDEPTAPYKGQPEVYQRGSLVGAHPGGTIEIQKVIIARRMGISRTKERAAATPSTTGAVGV